MRFKYIPIFFPHTWSRETVQAKIMEAYKYARKRNIPPYLQSDSNNFLLHGLTSENIKIEMIINQQGHLVTAYPVFPQ